MGRGRRCCRYRWVSGPFVAKSSQIFLPVRALPFANDVLCVVVPLGLWLGGWVGRGRTNSQQDSHSNVAVGCRPSTKRASRGAGHAIMQRVHKKVPSRTASCCLCAVSVPRIFMHHPAKPMQVPGELNFTVAPPRLSSSTVRCTSLKGLYRQRYQAHLSSSSQYMLQQILHSGPSINTLAALPNLSSATTSLSLMTRSQRYRFFETPGQGCDSRMSSLSRPGRGSAFLFPYSI